MTNPPDPRFSPNLMYVLIAVSGAVGSVFVVLIVMAQLRTISDAGMAAVAVMALAPTVTALGVAFCAGDRPAGGGWAARFAVLLVLTGAALILAPLGSYTYRVRAADPGPRDGRMSRPGDLTGYDAACFLAGAGLGMVGVAAGLVAAFRRPGKPTGQGE